MNDASDLTWHIYAHIFPIYAGTTEVKWPDQTYAEYSGGLPSILRLPQLGKPKVLELCANYRYNFLS